MPPALIVVMTTLSPRWAASTSSASACVIMRASPTKGGAVVIIPGAVLRRQDLRLDPWLCFGYRRIAMNTILSSVLCAAALLPVAPPDAAARPDGAAFGKFLVLPNGSTLEGDIE